MQSCPEPVSLISADREGSPWNASARCEFYDDTLEHPRTIRSRRPPEAGNVLAEMCEKYWLPIYSFIRRRGYAPSDAQDLTQSLFAYFLRMKAYARADPVD